MLVKKKFFLFTHCLSLLIFSWLLSSFRDSEVCFILVLSLVFKMARCCTETVGVPNSGKLPS